MKIIVLSIFAILLTLSYAPKGRAHHSVSLSNRRPPDKIDHLTYQDRLRWKRIIGWSNICDKDYEPRQVHRSGMQFWEIGHCIYLVEISCWCGAYNCSYNYFIFNNSQENAAFLPLSFITYQKSGSSYCALSTIELMGQSEYSVEEKVLTVRGLYRGLGDCREEATYKVHEDHAELISFKVKEECDGKWQDKYLTVIYP